MLKAIFTGAWLLAVAVFCAQRLALPESTAAPSELPVVTGAPASIVGTPQEPAVRRRLPNLGFDLAKSGWGFAVIGSAGIIGAYDLFAGHVAWSRAVPPGFNVAGVAAGVLFGSRGPGDFEAFDLGTGKQLWQSSATDGAVTGSPVYDSGLILQHFTEDGAAIAQFLFGVDAGTGRVRWYTLSNGILAADSHTAIIDSTWLAHLPEIYEPMTISAIGLSDGKALWTSTFAPDRDVNISANTGVHGSALLSGGYAYLAVRGRRYRYAVHDNASQRRVYGVKFLASLPSGKMLATRDGKLGIVTSLPDRLVYRPVALDLPSAMAVDSAGTVYAVAGREVVRFDGEEVRRIGRVDCANAASVAVWTGWVAVFCKTSDSEAALLFRQPGIREAQLHVTAEKPFDELPMHTVADVMEQWCIFCIVPEPGGKAVVSSGRDYAGNDEGFVRISLDGRPKYTRVLARPMTGLQLLEDREGTLWFNDNDGVVASVTSDGVTREQRLRPSGMPTQEIRIALDSGGNVWFARGGERPQIARIDGTRTIDLPKDAGEPLAMRGARDGSLWEVTKNALLRVTPAGSVERFSVPAVPNNVGDVPILLAASGADVWFSNRVQVLRVTPYGVSRRFTLPDATLSAVAVTAACDGSVYVSERVPRVIRFRADGTAQQYRTKKAIDALATGPDCRVWFVAGQSVGILGPP